jgi:hypothetical protein
MFQPAGDTYANHEDMQRVALIRQAAEPVQPSIYYAGVEGLSTSHHLCGGGRISVDWRSPEYPSLCGWDLAELWMRSSRVWMRSIAELWMRSSWVLMWSSWVWMRSSRVVRAFDCQCRSRDSPGFDPSIRRHSGISADEALLNKVRKKKNPPKKYLEKKLYRGRGYNCGRNLRRAMGTRNRVGTK